MKIVKHGCVIDFNCQVCGCEFLMSEEECYQEAAQDDKKGGEVQYLAVCPDCGEGDVPGYKKKFGELPEAEEQEPEEDQEPKGRGIDFTKTEFPSSI